MAATLVETSALTKRYGERAALEDVAITVRAGEVYGVLGPNGAGKTTLLRILAGLVRPGAGTATVLGGPAGSRRSLVNLGLLIESPAAYPYLSGRDNLRVFARYTGVSSRRIEQVLRIVELSDRADDRWTGYSLGMKQRLGVALALLKDPQLLILDEPTNGLDPAGVADMRELVRRLSAAGHTVLISSHLLAEVQQICDRVAVLSAGRLVFQGTVEELLGEGAIRVGAEPVEQAMLVAAELLGADQVRVDGDWLVLKAEPDAAARINRELVLAGICVRSLSWEQRSLEDVFLSLTTEAQVEATGRPGGS
jgi:ABC-2 type transport system ATP-binding protein